MADCQGNRRASLLRNATFENPLAPRRRCGRPCKANGIDKSRRH
jgi:hypothetical protein